MSDVSKKKILFVITKSNWGGAQRYVYDLATNLPTDEFEVAVALGGHGALEDKLRVSDIPVLALNSMQRDLSVGADINGFSSLYRSMRSYKPDVVHLNSSKAGGLGALAARLAGVPCIVFTAHGWPFEEKRNVLWRLFALLGSYATALLSHYVIVISKKDLTIGKRMPFCASKMRLIYNGIDLSKSFGSGEEIRAAFPPGSKITGVVGELTKNKNQMSLIERTKNTPQMYLAIVGEGEDRQKLETKIQEYKLSDRVKLFGFIPVEHILGGIDELALPSLKEGLPYILLEARVAGLPIIANRVGGVSDILDEPDLSVFSLDQMVQKTAALYR